MIFRRADRLVRGDRFVDEQGKKQVVNLRLSNAKTELYYTRSGENEVDNTEIRELFNDDLVELAGSEG